MFKLRSGNNPNIQKLSGSSAFPQVADAIKEKASDIKDKLTSVKDKAKSVVSKVSSTKDALSLGKNKIKSAATAVASKTKNIVKNPRIQSVTKGVSKVLKNPVSKTASRVLGPAGVGLAAKDAYDFLEKHQVGQTAKENIGQSSSRSFLGKI